MKLTGGYHLFLIGQGVTLPWRQTWIFLNYAAEVLERLIGTACNDKNEWFGKF